MNEKIKMERPILFSTEMIQAILDGRKTQTRRLNGLEDVNNYPGEILDYKGLLPSDYYLKKSSKKLFQKEPKIFHSFIGEQRTKNELNPIPVKCPYGKIGDVLWVRETFCIEGDVTRYFIYKADITKTMWNRFNWKPSIFMPKEACRIKLRITDIQVQKLQEITEEDAKKEGIKIPVTPEGNYLFELSAKYPNYKYFDNEKKNYFTACYAGLWDSLNLKRGYGWSLNPFIWVISFQIIKP